MNWERGSFSFSELFTCERTEGNYNIWNDSNIWNDKDLELHRKFRPFNSSIVVICL